MAKTTNKKDNSDGFFAALKAFFSDERTQFAFGVVLLIGVLYVFMALLSFFFTGEADQSIVNGQYSSIEELKDITNWTGSYGAYLAEVIINRWFGVAAFAFLWFPFVAALRLIGIRLMALWKAFLFSSLFMVWFSLFFEFFLSSIFDNTFIKIGGEHGELCVTWLKIYVGTPGTFFILLGTGVLFAIFAFSSTLPFFKRLFSKKGQTETIDLESAAVDFEEDEKLEENGETIPSDWIITESDGEEEDPHSTPTVKKVQVDDDASIEIEIESTVAENEVIDDYSVENLGLYDPTLELSDYKYPTLNLLKEYPQTQTFVNKDEQDANQKRIITTLRHYGIGIKRIFETVGPTITLYEIVPEDGVRISKIRNLEADIMLSLAATGIRIIAPIPGKGTIGIEVPNSSPKIVSMYATIGSKKFQESTYDLPIALGRTITNEVFMFDLCKMPHLLVAGATGQGKSVGLNVLITSLLYKKHPSQLKFVLIDPKKVEFNIYTGIEKHFLAKLPDEVEPVVTESEKVVQTLNSLCKEMDHRYDLLKTAHVRNIKEYNEKFVNRRLNPEKGHKFLPYIVVVIDEFGDLIMTAGKEVEMPIARIAQLARAVGIHMVIATQRPSVNIITGVIKANFPARIAFKVSAMVDSKIILDGSGAEQLVGKGDLLFSQGAEFVRVQCAFVDTPEVENVVQFISNQRGYPTAFELPEPDVAEADAQEIGAVDLNNRDELFEAAARLVVSTQQGSASNIQRRFSVGYNRAGRIVDQLEAAGIIGPYEGSKPRQVLVQTEYDLERILNNL